jgi:cytochrome c oxidase subunit II
MVDSSTVLWGQAIAYTIYVLGAMLLVSWFAYRVTRSQKTGGVPPALFWTFFALLIVCGVSLHIVSYNTIPWSPTDVHRDSIEADKTFAIEVEEHQFALPPLPMEIDCHDKVLFEVTSHDLTYGFGLFRADNSMLFQMQVLPGHTNDVLWEFQKNGVYSIRSTEYSGPAGYRMVVEDAVQVTGCPAET